MDKKKKGKYLNLKVENEHEIVCFVYRTAERRPILTFTWAPKFKIQNHYSTI
jgi:hypothetical protein